MTIEEYKARKIAEFDKLFPSEKGVSGGLYITMRDTSQLKAFLSQTIDELGKEIIEEIKSDILNDIYSNSYN